MMQAAGKRWVGIGIAAVLMLGLLAVPAWAQSPCDNVGTNQSAIQTRTELQRFVQCASDHVATAGWEQAITDFGTDSAWSDGPMSLFGLDENAILLFSNAEDMEPGTDLSDRQDADGVAITDEMIRIAQRQSAGFVYYRFLDSDTGEEELRVSYVQAVEEEGALRVLGADLHPLAIPGNCSAAHVRASRVYTASDLERFVNCAERHLRQHGIKALLDFNSDPRWKAGSIYMFLVDTPTLYIVAHGGLAYMRGENITDLIDPDDVLIGQELRRVAMHYGEGYVYYSFTNPATEQTEPKASYVKQVYVEGRSYILGAGVYVISPECRQLPLARDIDTAAELELYVTCARQLVQEQGEAAFDLLAYHDQWIGGSTYTVIMDDQCRFVVYPLAYQPEDFGTCDLEDAQGNNINLMIRDIAASEEGQGWIEYYWLNPDSNEVEAKRTFVMSLTLNGERHAIGAGLYGLTE